MTIKMRKEKGLIERNLKGKTRDSTAQGQTVSSEQTKKFM